MTADRTTVVLLHGFGQNARCWGRLADTLGRRHDVIALDLPGHGAAGAVVADLPTTADLVAGAIDADEPAALVGYSLGGRVALHVALAHPAVVSRLVLVSATAGIEDDADRAARRVADEALADRVEVIGVPAFVDEWLALPLFAGLPDGAGFVDERRSNSAAGLAASLRFAGAGTQEPLWERLHELRMPVLVIAGALDEKFSELAERMALAIGTNAKAVIVGGAGHSVHLEQPAATADLVTAFLDQV